MTSETHTLGPWHVEPWASESDDDHEWLVLCQDGNHEGDALICSVNTLLEADARLIAAAPDLLRELKEARTSLSITRTNIMTEIGRCADPSESRWEGVPELLKKRLDKIDAAIDRAEGWS